MPNVVLISRQVVNAGLLYLAQHQYADRPFFFQRDADRLFQKSIRVCFVDFLLGRRQSETAHFH